MKMGLRRWRSEPLLGAELRDWILTHAPPPTTRQEAVAACQALLEQGLISHGCEDASFLDAEGVPYGWSGEVADTGPMAVTECGVASAVRALLAAGPDAALRASLLKPYWTRSSDENQRIWEELNLIKALSHLSTMLKRQLASIVALEIHPHAGSVLFRQGDVGQSWYIILRGAVDVHIYGKGVVCSLHEGDDFGKLALVNDSPRAATIITREHNSHFLRVDKDHFDRILRDVEANTVRLREYGKDVLVLEKIPVRWETAIPPTLTPTRPPNRNHRYSVMAGKASKILEYILETRLDLPSTSEDSLLEDFLLTYPLFSTTNELADALSQYYFQDRKSPANGGRQLGGLHRRRVIQFLEAWARLQGERFFLDGVASAFLDELYSSIVEDASGLGRVQVESLMRFREQALAAAARSPRLILHTGLLTPPVPHPPSAPSDPVRLHDFCILRVHTLTGTYVSLKVAFEKTVNEIIKAAVLSLGIPLEELPHLGLLEVKSNGDRDWRSGAERGVGLGLSLNGRLWLLRRDEADAALVLREQAGPGTGQHLPALLLLTSSQTAARLALAHSALLQATHHSELLAELFHRPPSLLPLNLTLLIRAFNSLHFAVPTELLLAPNPHKRLLLLNKFIKIAAYCKFHQDLLGQMAIVLGLGNPAISRLEDLWARVPRKLRRKLREMEAGLEPARNHRAYRHLVAGMAPPIIPFLPLLLKDLAFVHQGNKTFFDSLLNFEKMHMIADVLRHFRHCKAKSFEVCSSDAGSEAEAQQLVRNFKVIDNQLELDALSRLLQPPHHN